MCMILETSLYIVMPYFSEMPDKLVYMLRYLFYSHIHTRYWNTALKRKKTNDKPGQYWDMWTLGYNRDCNLGYEGRLMYSGSDLEIGEQNSNSSLLRYFHLSVNTLGRVIHQTLASLHPRNDIKKCFLKKITPFYQLLSLDELPFCFIKPHLHEAVAMYVYKSYIFCFFWLQLLHSKQ